MKSSNFSHFCLPCSALWMSLMDAHFFHSLSCGHTLWRNRHSMTIMRQPQISTGAGENGNKSTKPSANPSFVLCADCLLSGKEGSFPVPRICHSKFSLNMVYLVLLILTLFASLAVIHNGLFPQPMFHYWDKVGMRHVMPWAPENAVSFVLGLCPSWMIFIGSICISLSSMERSVCTMWVKILGKRFFSVPFVARKPWNQPQASEI